MIYLDNNATTAPAPEVVAAMLPFLTEAFGNPSSQHGPGRAARQAVGSAREALAGLLGARTDELLFTASATEANHLALLGSLEADPARRQIVVSAVEHPSTLALCRQLERRGHPVTRLPVDRAGRIRLDALADALSPQTALVSVMWANNETGALNPIAEAAALAHAAGARFHTDATQAVGRVAIDLAATAVDLLTLSAHKFHGPKGVGALFVRKGLALAPLLHGHQERQRRGSTENVPGIAGLGAAAGLAARDLANNLPGRIAGLRDRLALGVLAGWRGCQVNGAEAPGPRLANTVNLRFTDAAGRPVDAEALQIRLDRAGICVSMGAACAAGSREPSPVLLATGLTPAEALASLRFSLSRHTTAAEIDATLDTLLPLAAKLAA